MMHKDPETNEIIVSNEEYASMGRFERVKLFFKAVLVGCTIRKDDK